MARPGSSTRLLALLTLAAAAAACARVPNAYHWVTDLPDEPAPSPEYVIAANDVLSIRVWNQEQLSTRSRVRADGNLSLPLLREVQVLGLTPAGLSRKLEGLYKEFIVKPMVTVTVEESRPLRVLVLGEVTRPGLYDLEYGNGVLHALGAAGGLTQYGGHDSIYVLRHVARSSSPVRIRFRLDALTRGEARSSGFRLQPGDVVIVE
jgi:polysaccharide export outer membrane protein